MILYGGLDLRRAKRWYQRQVAFRYTKPIDGIPVESPWCVGTIYIASAVYPYITDQYETFNVEGADVTRFILLPDE